MLAGRKRRWDRALLKIRIDFWWGSRDTLQLMVVLGGRKA